MKDHIWHDAAKRRDYLLAATTYFVTVILSSWLGRQLPHTGAMAMAGAATMAAGTLGIAWILARHVAYPRRSYLGAAVILAAASLLSVFVVADPDTWAREARQELWMGPWFLLMVALLPPRATGACAPRSTSVGWLLVGGAALFAALSWVAMLIAHRA